MPLAGACRGRAVGRRGDRAAGRTYAHLAPGTPIRLMVLKEVDTGTARSGDRFRLRVDEPVIANGPTVVAVGADAWGGDLRQRHGAVGSRGRFTARLLDVDLPSGPLPITGVQAVDGRANGTGVAIAVASFGLLGLLTKGGNAHFEAGDILTGYAKAYTDEAAAATSTDVATGR